MNVERFVAAQDEVWDQVRLELAQGDKRTHWMWFVFPQIAGLGSSPMARHYAIADLDEARAYLDHPILGARLAEATQLLMGWAGRRDAGTILGSIDAMKFRSSMTLFEAAGDDGATVCFGAALDGLCEGHRDERTLQLLRSQAAPGTNGPASSFHLHGSVE